MTKTETGCESYFHSHTNCWLSACFYFDHGSPIKFQRQRESFTDSGSTGHLTMRLILKHGMFLLKKFIVDIPFTM